MRAEVICYLLFALRVSAASIISISAQTLNDEVPFRAICPGLSVDRIFFNDSAWDLELRLQLDSDRFHHALFLEDANKAAGAHPWVFMPITNDHDIDTNWGDLADAQAGEIELAYWSLGDDVGSISHAVAQIRFVRDSIAEISPHLDIRVGLRSVHRDVTLNGMLDSDSTRVVRIFPDVFNAQPASLVVTLQQEVFVVREATARLLVDFVAEAAAVELKVVIAESITLAQMYAARYTTVTNLPFGNRSSMSLTGLNVNSFTDITCPSSRSSVFENCSNVFLCSNEFMKDVNPIDPKTVPIVMEILFPITYTQAIANGVERVILQVNVSARADDGSIISETVAIGAEQVTECSERPLVASAPPQYELVLQHTFVGAKLDLLGVPNTPPADAYDVGELQRFALYDGLLTLALLVPDEHVESGIVKQVSLTDLVIIRVRNSVAYEKLRTYIDLNRAFSTDADTNALSIAPEFAELCQDPESVCSAVYAVRAGVVEQQGVASRHSTRTENAAFLDSVPQEASRGSELAASVRDQFLDLLEEKLQPNVRTRTVWFVNARALPPVSVVRNPSFDNNVERLLVLASYTTQTGVSDAQA
jgi:hypothetical protein